MATASIEVGQTVDKTDKLYVSVNPVIPTPLTQMTWGDTTKTTAGDGTQETWSA